jgi:hypothetical protein
MQFTLLALLAIPGVALANPVDFEAGGDNETKEHSRALSGRSKQTYIPTWCKDKDLKNCQKPKWEVDKCNNFAQLGLDNSISSYMIPHPLSCIVYDWPNCNTKGYVSKFCSVADKSKCKGPYAGKSSTTWNAGTVKNIKGDSYNDVASSIICRMSNK